MADVAVQPALDAVPTAAPEQWSLGRRLYFRFFFVYWLLFALPEGGAVVAEDAADRDKRDRNFLGDLAQRARLPGDAGKFRSHYCLL